jgi:hypothetical protein
VDDGAGLLNRWRKPTVGSNPTARTGGVMFIYENGLPIDYLPTGSYNEETTILIRTEMLRWYRSLPGQVRMRQGKVDRMRGQEVNLRRLENE